MIWVTLFHVFQEKMSLMEKIGPMDEKFISFQDFQNFNHVINNIDDLKVIFRLFLSSGRNISSNEFHRDIAKICQSLKNCPLPNTVSKSYNFSATQILREIRGGIFLGFYWDFLKISPRGFKF